jgi:hypothetical protein
MGGSPAGGGCTARKAKSCRLRLTYTSIVERTQGGPTTPAVTATTHCAFRRAFQATSFQAAWAALCVGIGKFGGGLQATASKRAERAKSAIEYSHLIG